MTETGLLLRTTPDDTEAAPWLRVVDAEGNRPPTPDEAVAAEIPRLRDLLGRMQRGGE